MVNHEADAKTVPDPATSDPALDLKDVTLELGSEAGLVKILHGVSVAVPRGQVLSIVGPSGSGKSSLMMIMGGLERATTGQVTVAGTELTGLNEDQLALFRRDRVGIVFQNFHLVPTMTALENVAIPLEFAGRDDAFDRARDGLEAVGLGHRLRHYPGQLSGGEQQRCALARAFAPRPAVLLADEPTGNLDQATGEKVIALMFDLARQGGSTLVLITHDPDLAERCDRLVHLVDGRITEDRPTRAAVGPQMAAAV